MVHCSVNHRHDIRKPLKVNVELYHWDEFLGRCSTLDVNTGGLFVETARLDLRRNAILELIIDIDQDDDADPPTLRAMVIHQSQKGVGLMFCDADRSSLDTRNALLSAAV